VRCLLPGPRGTEGRTGWFTSFREANGIEARRVESPKGLIKVNLKIVI